MKSFNKYFRSKAKNILAYTKIYTTRLTDYEKLNNLIFRLHPISSKNDLIRLGPNEDGGYLVPDDLKDIQACFSPGVGITSKFEKDCAELGMKIFIADKSVIQPAEVNQKFNFSRKHIGAISNSEFMTLDEWVGKSKLDNKSDLLLQMDIEGYEYEVIFSMTQMLLQRFRIIVAEFHHLGQLWNGPFFNIACRAFDKILQSHYCAHIHPNNTSGMTKIFDIEVPKTMEFTFIRKDRIKKSGYQRIFPHPLDFENAKDKPNLVLPQCWYRSK